ncbi:MAG TPA: hypothetical protein PKJ95_00280 [Atribacterota bacterium]|nr:hypothetical protein [Atribacterota bacterium]
MNSIEEFFNLLFKPGEIVEFRPIKPKWKGGGAGQSEFIKFNGDIAGKIKDYIHRKNEDYNLYFGVIPRKGSGERSKVSRVNTCFVDIDSKDFTSEEEFTRHIQTLENEILPSIDLKYTAKINSGHGFHYYFVLSKDEKLPIENNTCDAWRDVQCALIDICKADQAVGKDLPRILRLPGSMNIKEEGAFKDCKILEVHKENIYRYSHFLPVLKKHRKEVLKKEEAKKPSVRVNYPALSMNEGEIIEKLQRVKNADKFNALFYKGDTSPYGNDTSRADQALVNMIAFYTKDEAVIDNIFRQSALYREKWDKETYKKSTIKKAIEGQTGTYDPNYGKALFNPSSVDNTTLAGIEVKPAIKSKPLPPSPAGEKEKPVKEKEDKPKKENVALNIFNAIKDREELQTAWDGKKLYILTKNKKWSEVTGIGEMELLSKIYDITGMVALNKDTIKTIKDLLKLKHYKEGKEKTDFFKRTAMIQDSIIYNGGDFTVKIRPGSWEIGEHEALFFENRNQVQQEKPDVNYKEKNLMDLLKDIVPTKTDDELLLMAIYITSLFIPDIPKPALNIEGDHGSGKTCIARVIKEIYDPGEVKSVNKINTEDLCLNFAVNDFMVLNNLSKINTSLSDILCCIIDGETISKRKLYEDDSLFVKKVKGTFAITSISVGKKNADLLDRMLKINLQRIEDEDRKTEKKIGRHFRGKKPFILSSIFNILSEAMNYIEDIEEKEISRFRLADWYMWSLSIARALDAEEKFKSIIEQQKKMMLEDQLQDDEKIEILYNYLMEQVTDRPFEISSKELKTQLNEQSKNSKPLFTGHIGYFLKRVIVTFKGYGFNIENIRKAGGKRIWRVTKISDRVTNSDKPENTSLSLKENHIPQGKKSISDRVTDDFFSLEKKEIEKRNLPLIEDNRNPISSEKSLSLCHSCKKVSDSNNIISDKLSDKLISSSVTQKSLSLIKCSNCDKFTAKNRTAFFTCEITGKSIYPMAEHTCNNFNPVELAEDFDREEIPF